MKTLEQLGISPAPWHIEENTGVLCAKSEHYKHPIVDDCGNFENNNDKRLIAAAPDLYKSLIGLLEIVCVDCNSAYKVDGKCVKCPRVVAAEAALEKAGGAE